MTFRVLPFLVVNLIFTLVALGAGGWWPLALVTFLFGIGGLQFGRMNARSNLDPPPTWPCGSGGWRFRQHLHAKLHGYFWLPCPVCGRKFGGQEWEPGNSIFDNPDDPHRGKGVCSRECRDLFVLRGGIAL